MIDLPQTFSIALEMLIALVLIGVLVWMRSIGSSQQRMLDTQAQITSSQRDITATQQNIAQMQREQTAVLQNVITQIAVMEARQEGSSYPNDYGRVE